MPTCSAFNCTYKHVNKTSGKTVHAFPFSRPEIFAKWMINIRRKDWYPNKRSLVCSDHFESECFDKSGRIVRLKPDAVPTIFDFPTPPIKQCKQRKVPTLRSSGNESGESLRKLKRKLEQEKEKNSVYHKKLKIKQQHISKLEKKIISMNELINHLEKRQLMGENAGGILKENFSNASLDLLTKMLENKDGKLLQEECSPSLRSFTLTLQFFSSKAYDYMPLTKKMIADLKKRLKDSAVQLNEVKAEQEQLIAEMKTTHDTNS